MGDSQEKELAVYESIVTLAEQPFICSKCFIISATIARRHWQCTSKLLSFDARFRFPTMSLKIRMSLMSIAKALVAHDLGASLEHEVEVLMGNLLGEWGKRQSNGRAGRHPKWRLAQNELTMPQLLAVNRRWQHHGRWNRPPGCDRTHEY